MIWLFNSKSKVYGFYKSFEEVCDHFRRIEHLKPVPEGGSYNGQRWDFAYWPHKRLSSLHEHLKETHFSQAEREAYEGELDLVEVFDGRSDFADQYIVTSDLDIGSLMKEWCFDYAYAHGHTILETFSTRLSNATASVVHPTLEGLDCVGFLGALKEGNAIMTFT